MYVTVVTDFIKTFVEDCIPTKTVHSFPNQKLWINAEIWRKIDKSRDAHQYKKCWYDL